MIGMLDKKVVKYTRDGIQQTNLTTGETQMLTVSKHGREIRYSGNGQSRYEGKERSTTKAKVAYSRSVYQVKHGLPANPSQPEKKSGVRADSSRETIYRPGKSKPGSMTAGTSRRAELMRMPVALQKRSESPITEHRSSANDRIFLTNTSPALLPGSADSSSRYRRHTFRSAALRAGEDSSEDLEENDNLGISAVGTYGKFGYRSARGVQNFRNRRVRRRYLSDGKYGRKAGRTVTSRARSAVQSAAGSAKKAVKAIQAVTKTLANPMTWKIIAVIVGILLIFYSTSQIAGSFAASIGGSTTEHPDLTNYVMQLDTDFQTKVSDIINSYKSKSDTTVTVEGSNVINTDENALAILVTGDWTDIQLNEQNKNRLRNAHSVLNTYSVSDAESTVTETTDDGQTVTKTVHKVTVYINTYTAKDKIDSFGFDSDKKAHVLEMLDLLDQIDNVNQRNVTPTPGGGGSPGASYDDPQVQALINEAEKYLGYPYVWGGSTPATSFDCSGFVSWVYTHSGVHNLPRTTAQGIFNQCTVVSASEAKPGDLVFFKDTYPTSNTVTHIGIYVGNGRMLHCGDPIQYTSLNKTYWQQHFYAYGRLK